VSEIHDQRPNIWLISYQEEFGYLNFEYIEAVSTRTLDFPVSDRLILSRGVGHLTVVASLLSRCVKITALNA
jgi:hypothetical protein